MNSQSLRFAVTVVLVAATFGCGSPSTPTSPSPPAPAPAPTAPSPPPVAGSLFGTVSVQTSGGIIPLDDVEVYCDSCGPGGHTFLYTDGAGFYRFPDVIGGVTPILIRKPGYSVVGALQTFPDGTGQLRVIVNGNTRFDIELTPR